MTLRRLELWLPPLLLMGTVFFFSAQPDLNSGLGTIDTVGRKVIHAAEYALAAFLVTVAYAATDEYHQSFVQGRHGSPLDWAIDAGGAGAASLRLARREKAPR